MARVRYVGPFDEVDLNTADFTATVKRDEVIEVPDEVVGSPRRETEDGIDPGSGLLAQPSNWEVVETTEPVEYRPGPSAVQDDDYPEEVE